MTDNNQLPPLVVHLGPVTASVVRTWGLQCFEAGRLAALAQRQGEPVALKRYLADVLFDGSATERAIAQTARYLLNEYLTTPATAEAVIVPDDPEGMRSDMKRFRLGTATAEQPAEPVKPETGTSDDLAEAADLVGKVSSAKTNGEALALILSYRKRVRSEALTATAPAPVARDREADRARLTDPDFNRWLDEPITENGEFTVWNMLNCTSDAHAGWINRASYEVGFNGLTEAETAATASVSGLAAPAPVAPTGVICWARLHPNGEPSGEFLADASIEDVRKRSGQWIPLVPAAPVAPKDHEIARAVNELRDIAVKFHGAQQLRERISHVVTDLVRKQAAPVAEVLPDSTVKESLTDALCLAAVNCPHHINEKRVVLHFNPDQPGHNALNQLSRRLIAAMSAAPPAPAGRLDALTADEAAAHIMPSVLEKFKRSECTDLAYSIAVGSPDERSVPLFTREQCIAAMAASSAPEGKAT